MPKPSRHWIAAAALLCITCAVPGKLYRVAPAISGSLRGAELTGAAPSLALSVVHRESPRLFDGQTTTLSADGRFAFHATELAVAGHEYSKHYRVYLHVRLDDRDRVVWRGDLSRTALAGPIALDCDLDRPPEHGQPCWVRDPLAHPWLIEDGERTFRRLCSGCHGNDGSGNPTAKMQPPPPDLREIAARRGGEFDRVAIAEWIEGRVLAAAHGERRMPIWGETLSEAYQRYPDKDAMVGATLAPVVVYLESIQR